MLMFGDEKHFTSLFICLMHLNDCAVFDCKKQKQKKTKQKDNSLLEEMLMQCSLAIVSTLSLHISTPQPLHFTCITSVWDAAMIITL